MISEIRIKNYKSVQKLKLELGRVNVFIGANGCGKSNILEAIALGAITVGGHLLSNEIFISRGIRVTAPKAMRSAFEEETQDKNIELTFIDSDKEEWGIELKHDNKPFSTWTPRPAEKLDARIAELSKKIGKIITLNDIKENFETVRQLYDFAIYSPENVKLREFAGEGTSALGIHGSGLFYLLSVSSPEEIAEIKEHLKLIDWFDNFEMGGNEKTNEKKINIKDKYATYGNDLFDQRNTNEGFLFLLFYLSLFISKYTPSFFAIDNIDNALNPKLCSSLAKRLITLSEKHNKQVVLTTHNPVFLDGLDLNDDNQRLFIVYRNADGHTKAKRVLTKPSVEGGIKLSEALIRGYLGALNEI